MEIIKYQERKLYYKLIFIYIIYLIKYLFINFRLSDDNRLNYQR
jgi:hypothetical protein